MPKIQIFLELVRDASLLYKPTPTPTQHVRTVAFLAENLDAGVTNYVNSTDIPMDQTIDEYLKFAYAGGPKPKMLAMHGL
jgi:hypothetical protein